MALRWCVAGMVEATTQFRRVNGHLHLALTAHLARTACRNRECSVNEHNHISNAA
jgi:hypothetical protein